MFIMKKTYIKPVLSVHGVNMSQMICLSLGGEATENSKGLSKDRGSRSDDNDNFEDLW